jgi:hypothetical protein
MQGITDRSTALHTHTHTHTPHTIQPNIINRMGVHRGVGDPRRGLCAYACGWVLLVGVVLVSMSGNGYVKADFVYKDFNDTTGLIVSLAFENYDA